MEIRVSDLPHEARQELLRRIREQMGESQYRSLVEAVGEDKLLEAAFQQAGAPAREPARGSPPTWLMWVGWIAAVALLGGLGWLVGGRVGWIFGGAAMGLVLAPAWFGGSPGCVAGAVLGGAVGGGAGGSGDSAFGGALGGGVLGLLIQLGLGWLAKTSAEMTRTWRP